MAEYPEYIKNSYKSTRKKPNNPRENNELSTEYAINIQEKKKQWKWLSIPSKNAQLPS